MPLGFAKSTNLRVKPQLAPTLGSWLLAGVHINPSPDKKRSTRAKPTQKVAAGTGCQVWSNELLTHFLRQLLHNRRRQGVC
jgi:hypothetical protein